MKIFEFQKYLRKNLSRKINFVSENEQKTFKIWTVIPILNELDSIEKTLASLSDAIKFSQEDIAVLLIINNSVDTCSQWVENNQKLMQKILNKDFSYIENLAFIDASSKGNELSYGVGEARKIGMDSICHYINDANAIEDSFFVSLDADTVIEQDYFEKMVKGFENFGALTFDVKHYSNNKIEDKYIKIYERYMETYLEGLQYANSPFAFRTIGSAFACRVSAYIKAGGMRKLLAGEDFYFLQAVAKTSKVKYYPEIKVYPSARISKRVPFGTGVAISEMLEGKSYEEFKRENFEELKKLLELATQENLENIELFLKKVPERAKDFLLNNNFVNSWEKILKNNRREKLPEIFKYQWFDGLKTIQFVKKTKKN